MALFDDLVSGSDGVYTITNRPDLVAETKLAVRQATLAAHRSELYPRDRKEVALPLTSSMLFQLDIPSYFPNWRKFDWIRPYTVLTGSPSPILITDNEFLTPGAVLDEYLVEKVNVAYVAGTNLNVKLQTAYDGLLVGYYQNPVLSPEASYESWIAREHPAVIVLDAAMRVLDAIGYNDAARRLEVLLLGSTAGSTRAFPLGGEYLLLKQSALESAGR